MVRRKSTPQSTDSLPLPQIPSPSTQEIPIKKHVRVVEEFDQFVTPAPPSPPPSTTPAQSHQPAPQGEFDEDEDDPIEELLDRIEREQGYFLRVDRLTHYHQTGRVGRGAPKAFCGEWPFTRDYLPEIQAMYGPGSYRLTLTDSVHKFVKTWVEHIAAPLQAPFQPQSTTAPVHVMTPNPTPATEQPGLENFAKSLQTFASIKKTMDSVFSIPDSQVHNALPVPAEKTPEERQLELLLSLVDKNDRYADLVFDKYFGQSRRDPTVVEVIGEMVKPYVPWVLQLLHNIMVANIPALQAAAAAGSLTGGSRQASATPPTGTSLPPPEPSTPAAGNPADVRSLDGESGDPGHPAEQGGEEEEPYMEVIGRLVEECARSIAQGIIDQASLERARVYLAAFREEYPEWAALLDTLMNGPPEAVLSGLVLIYPDMKGLDQSPLAIDWIAALQKTLTGES